MDSPATYLHWGFILISWPNLLVIIGMIVLFALALVVPFPHGGEGDDVRNDGAGTNNRRRIAELDAEGPAGGRGQPAHGPPAPRSPALLHRVMGLRLRRDHDCRPRLGDRQRRGPVVFRPAVVA